MIYPSADTLENWGSKYSLVVLEAKRAKQIKSCAPPLISTHSRNPLTIALEEIAAGKVQCQVADHDILPKTSTEAEVAQLLAIPTTPVDEEEGAETAEASAVLTDDSDLLIDEEEEEEEESEEEEAPGVEDEEEDDHESPFVPDVEEDEEAADEDEDVEAEAVEGDVDAPGVIPAEEPKPKARRGRKPKAEKAETAGEGSEE
jgi:DNA-directed RNA polymerase subunit omega